MSVLWISLSADVPSEKRRPPKYTKYIIVESRYLRLSYSEIPSVLHFHFHLDILFQ